MSQIIPPVDWAGVQQTADGAIMRDLLRQPLSVQQLEQEILGTLITQYHTVYEARLAHAYTYAGQPYGPNPVDGARWFIEHPDQVPPRPQVVYQQGRIIIE